MPIRNPVLPGFHPDPSIIRVDDVYYIANSTFEWFGGVEIHRSYDLRHWEFVTRPLATLDMLNMKGNPASGGIWAPCLSWSDDQFWLIFTDVKSWNKGPYKICHNYLTCAPSITGPWSVPIYLNSSGFDPSLFHDDDGRKWFVNMEWDYRQEGVQTFSGILLQQFDARTKTLFGPITKIFTGTTLGLTEGPHIYKRNNWYYLMTAEGGTSYEHAVTLARSRHLEGPYEVHPANPLVTSHKKPHLYLQKAGHGSMCPAGFSGNSIDEAWILAFLIGRPLPGRKDCILGRETALAHLVWRNDWPYLEDGSNDPPETVSIAVNNSGNSPKPESNKLCAAGLKREYFFDNEDFLNDFMSLRIPLEQRMSLNARPGFLRLTGAEAPVSTHTQTILCRRQTDFCFLAETKLQFDPWSFQHQAGLIYRYDEDNQYFLRISWNEQVSCRSIGIIMFDEGRFSLPLGKDEVLINSGEVYLRVLVHYSEARFFWSENGSEWQALGHVFDAGILSDDHGGLGFTGAFVGMACVDGLNQSITADFEYFTYEGKDISTERV